MKRGERLTLEELAQRTGHAESTLRTKWNRTKENLAKKGIIIEKKGYGQNADYTLYYIDKEK